MKSEFACRGACVCVWRVRFRSALEDAANEDGHGELHDSEDDLLESSDEEDDDLVQNPQRMPEPRSKSAQPKVPSMVGSQNHSSSTCDVPPNIPTGNDDRGGGGNGSDSHIRTRVGARPSVAFQMQEMEDRPCEDDDPTASPECNDAQRQDPSRESKEDSGSTDNFVREYMVRASFQAAMR